jgi:hypothetical protein
MIERIASVAHEAPAAFMKRRDGHALCSLNHYSLDLILADRGSQ